jgi:hypothetical protein
MRMHRACFFTFLMSLTIGCGPQAGASADDATGGTGTGGTASGGGTGSSGGGTSSGGSGGGTSSGGGGGGTTSATGGTHSATGGTHSGTGSLNAGWLRGCLGTDDAAVIDEGWSWEYQVGGTIVGNEEGDPSYFPLSDMFFGCEEATVVLAWRSENDSTWWLGLVGEDQSGSIVPTVGATLGASVEVLFRQDANESGSYFGAVAREEGRLLLAARNARLGEEDLPEVVVTPAHELAEESSDCGTRTYYAVQLQADDTLTLEIGEQGDLSVAGASMLARHVNWYDWSDIQCTDLGTEQSFMVWR